MSPKNESNYTPVASLASSRADIGFLELVDGKVVINGFHSIAGKKFIITNVLGKTVFSPYDENSNEIPSAAFTEADLSNPTMIDFLHELNAFNVLFVRFVSNWFSIPGVRISSINDK